MTKVVNTSPVRLCVAFVFSAAILFSVSPYFAYAQNELTVIKNELIKDDFKLTDPKQVHTAKYLIDGIQGSITAIHLNPMNPCGGGGGGGGVCVPLNLPDPDRIGPAARGIPMEAMIPGSIASKVDGMYSSTMVKALDENISAPLILQAVSMFLAEPAVAQGVSNAKMEAAAHHHSMMLDDIRTKQISELFPGSEQFVKTYMHCIEEEMVENGRSLVDSKIICQQDRNWTNVAAPSMGIATGYTFNDMPGFDATTANPLKITLTDLIFNPETLTYPVLSGSTRIEKVKESFKKRFGDILYELEPDLGNTQAGSGGTWIPRKATYKVLEPYEDPNDGHSAEFTYYTKLHAKFDLLRWILYRYCRYKNDSTMGGNIPAIPPSLRASFMEAFLSPLAPVFFTDLPVPMPDLTAVITGEDALKQLSLPGLAMNPTFLRPIFAKINGSWLPHDITGGGDKLRCDELETPLDPSIFLFPSLAPLPSPLPLQDWIDNEVKPRHQAIAGVGGSVPGLYTELLFIARRLALGEFLVEASMAEQIIKYLSAGVGTGPKAEMLNEGLKLIYKAVGTDNIKGSLDATLSELRVFLGRQAMELDAMNAARRASGPQRGKKR